MLKCDQPEKPKKTYTIPKVSKKRQAQIDSGEFVPKAKTPIKHRSDKRAKQEREYLKLNKEYLEAHPICEGRIKCSGALSSEVHHAAGRIGKLLTDTTKFKALCHECHIWAELNPEQAKVLGISENRL